MFGGEFSVTLDDACRISLPRRLRDALHTDKVILTKGGDRCLWLFTVECWREQERNIINSTNPFSAQGRRITRYFVGSSQELDIDKQGRILIPPTLREFAGLIKDCIVLGQPGYIEIWAKDRYDTYADESENNIDAASEELGITIMRNRELGNYGNSSCSGFTGGDSTIPCPEG